MRGSLSPEMDLEWVNAISLITHLSMPSQIVAHFVFEALQMVLRVLSVLFWQQYLSGIRSVLKSCKSFTHWDSLVRSLNSLVIFALEE